MLIRNRLLSLFNSAVFCIAVLGAAGGLPLSAHALGGPDGVLEQTATRMEQLVESGEMTADEAKALKKQMAELGQKFQNRYNANGSLNIQRDKDLYQTLDALSAPIYQRYNASKAKTLHDKRELGFPNPRDVNDDKP